MDGRMSHLLPAAVAKKKIPDAVQLVSAWALLTATAFLFSFPGSYAINYALDYYNVTCSQSSFLQCDQLTDAEDAEHTALWIRILCCAALQAAAAMVALRLPGLRPCVRLALAYLTLVLTILDHCLYATAARLFLIAHPGDLVIWICCTMTFLGVTAGDLICFLALLVLGGEELD